MLEVKFSFFICFCRSAGSINVFAWFVVMPFGSRGIFSVYKKKKEKKETEEGYKFANWSTDTSTIGVKTLPE